MLTPEEIEQPGDEAPAREAHPARPIAPTDIPTGDKVGGDKIAGDKVGGDKITVYQYATPQPGASIDLSEATAQLAALPLDRIPEAAPLPPGSRMPLSRNPLFVGREDDLKALAATLKGGATAAIGQIAAATWLGGIGKTQLACEFVHRYGQHFMGGVFWLNNCEDEPLLEQWRPSSGGCQVLLTSRRAQWDVALG
jgi:hypothetical protein